MRLLISWRNKIEQTKYTIFIIVAFGVLLRIVSIPLFSTTYQPVDVFYVDNQAAKLILGFQNPYSQNLAAHGYSLNMFAYLPMVPIYYAPFYLLGDIRIGNMFADILIMFSLFYIAKSVNRGAAAFFAPLAYAILPFSIWLTSIASTNIMVGASFLTVSVAGLLKKKHLLSAIFLGFALATNQLMFLALPLIIFYLWGEHKISYFLGSLLVASGIVLPFFVQDTFQFIYDVVLFQFQRPLQRDGVFSLYSLVNTTMGLSLTSWIRVSLFIAATLFSIISLWRKTVFLVPLIGTLLLLGAFILPVNGFWNYFLPGAIFLIACIPYVIDELTNIIEKSTSTSPRNYSST